MPKSKSNKVGRLAAEVRALKLATKAVKVVKRAKKASQGGKSGGFFGSVGKSLGGMAGGFLGGLATKALMSVTGMGDYKVHRNSLYVHSLNTSPPPVFRSDSHSTRIVHREFLGDVTGNTGAFTQRFKLPINPNQAQTFPWLSNIAVQFEEYKFHGLIFEFKSTSGNAVSSTNAALGTVFMATQYNVYAPDFRDKQTLDAYEYSVSTRADTSILHPIECDPKLNDREVYFVDSSQFAAGGDLRMTNMGNFYLCVAGQQSANTIGELWVTYDVELLKPRMQTNAAGAAEANSAIYYNGSASTGNQGPMIVADLFKNMALLPDSATTTANGIRPSLSNFPIKFGTVANGFPNTIFFPPTFRGKIMWLWSMRVSTGTSSGSVPLTSSAVVPPSLTFGPGVSMATMQTLNRSTLGFTDSTASDNVYNASFADAINGNGVWYIKYILFFDGSSQIDPVTGNSQASLGVSTTFFTTGGTTAVTWHNQHEFYPVFL